MLVVEAKWEARGPACTELLCRKGVQEGGSTGLRPGRRPVSRGVAEKTGRAGVEGERCQGDLVVRTRNCVFTLRAVEWL